ncbi:glucosamine-6-phosphate deaminase [Moorella sp. Hama-1]|uniref:glucosamine-6-phosphate deaminase n=1 Tax=Moorella sp. Hama-1 TaxID=2138101 RepID=UPI000D65664C|nr:glucosamine-6-phosphate deaminase [Moorella sp. Hama-1]MDN5362681.1 glucosamine-6-phosphate deaminase [Moorella sp. (in: firmicutes)]BCV22892.1 glucosamine-6-phosphate deaminase [Moorella sp. Hama-1]
MEVLLARDYHQLSQMAARLVAAAIKEKPALTLGLATGATPLGLYRELVRLYQEGELDFSQVVTFNLDEYYGLFPDDPCSYHYYMETNFFQHVNLRRENIHLPPGRAEDVTATCAAYEAAIAAAGGIDLQVLGIGRNGHIGFNEPGAALNATTHLIDLAPETIRANARFFASINAVPRQAISMGMGSIMKARRILLLASGRDKAWAVAAALEGPVTTRVPASLLQLHPRVTVILDRAASRQLQGKANRDEGWPMCY